MNMTQKLNLDIQTILDKEFNIDFKGYNASEVDAFLDMVIEDYDTNKQIVEELNDKIGELERTNASLRAKLIEMEGKTRAMETNAAQSPQSAGNVDILKRLSRLEEKVFEQSKDRYE